MSIAEAVRRITEALDRAGIAYMLSGSLASAYYGLPRSTQDIDLVIEATELQLRTFVKSLPPDEYYADVDAALAAHRGQSLFNVIDLTTGWKVDLITRKARAFSQQEFVRRQPASLQGLQLFVASAEDLVIAKLEWSKLAQSQRQIEDVAAILKNRGGTLDRSYLRKWIGELEVESEWKQATSIAGMAESI
jgi:hypothetical protein